MKIPFASGRIPTGVSTGSSSGARGIVAGGKDTSIVQLERINAALRRLDNGRFGHCLYCGDQISVKRLKHDPAIDSCAVCDEN